MYTLVELKSKYHLAFKHSFAKDGVRGGSDTPLRMSRDTHDRDGQILCNSKFFLSYSEPTNYAISNNFISGCPQFDMSKSIVVVHHNTTTIPDIFKSPDYIITDDENDKDPRSIYVPADENRSVQNLDKLIQERRMINHNLDKTQIKLLMNYDMEHVLVALDKAFTAKNEARENSKVEFLTNKVHELIEMFDEFQTKFAQKATI